MIPKEIVEAIRERTDLVALIGRHVRLDKKGKDWVGLCPFHKEGSPSFAVIPDKNFYYCYGCQASGDCFGFLTKIEGLTFYEAVKQLADAVGIRIESTALTPAMAAQLTAKQRAFSVLEAANQHFQSLLWVGHEGAAARAYLQARGLPDDVAQSFGLGLSPDGYQGLSDALVAKGFHIDDLIATGLAKRRDTGGAYDLFRNRLMIPITDVRGRVIAFGGRLLAGEGPKYINSPETELYHKGSVLYGWAAAQKQIRTSRRVILVEGYFDVIAMHRAGFSEAVATCGTALTETHAQMIRNVTPAVFLLTDTDNAGEIAAEKALPLLRSKHLQTSRPTLKGAKDPDEALQTQGPSALEQALAASPSLLSAVARRKVRAYGFSAAGRERALDEMIDLLPALTDAEIEELSTTLGLSKQQIKQWIKWKKRQAGGTPPAAPGAAVAQAPERLVLSPPNMSILWLVLHRRDEVADLLNVMEPTDIDERILPIVARLLSGEPALRLLDEALPDDVRDLLEHALAKRNWIAPSDAAQALAENATALAMHRIDAALHELKDQQPASAEGNEATSEWLRKYQSVVNQRNEVKQLLARKAWAKALARLRLDAGRGTSANEG